MQTITKGMLLRRVEGGRWNVERGRWNDSLDSPDSPDSPQGNAQFIIHNA